MRVRYLLEGICRDLGYCECGRDPDSFEGLATSGVDALTRAVLRAEGLDPRYSKQQFAAVRSYIATAIDQWASDAV